MLQMRPNCECCDVDLPPDGGPAYICSFECTFCDKCAYAFGNRCPNCGGDLMVRPARPTALLGQFPGSSERVLKPHPGCTAAA